MSENFGENKFQSKLQIKARLLSSIANLRSAYFSTELFPMYPVQTIEASVADHVTTPPRTSVSASVQSAKNSAATTTRVITTHWINAQLDNFLLC